MGRREQLDWEARFGRVAAAAALASGLLLILGGFGGFSLLLLLLIDEIPGNAVDSLVAVDRQPGAFIAARVLQSIGVVLLAVVLYYLYRVTRFRREETPNPALVLSIAGPLVVAALGVVNQVDLVDVAEEFAAAGPRTEDRAEDLLREGGSPAIGAIGIAGAFALALAFVLIGINAMRAGVLSRFMGILGIIIGVLYVIPLLGGPQIVQLFCLGALALLFMVRWLGGRGPAGVTCEAVPVPSSVEQR